MCLNVAFGRKGLSIILRFWKLNFVSFWGSIIVSQLCGFGLNLSAVSGYFAILSAVNG